MIVEAQISIAAAKPLVWAFLGDIEGYAKSISGIVRLEVVERPAVGLVGLRWRETRVLFGDEATVEKWITEAVDGEYYMTRAESHGFIFLSSMKVEEAGGQCILKTAHDSQPQTFLTRLQAIPMRLFFKGVIRKALMQDLEDIKKAVEGAAK